MFTFGWVLFGLGAAALIGMIIWVLFLNKRSKDMNINEKTQKRTKIVIHSAFIVIMCVMAMGIIINYGGITLIHVS